MKYYEQFHTTLNWEFVVIYDTKLSDIGFVVSMDRLVLKFDNGTAISIFRSHSSFLNELNLSDIANATIAGDGHHVLIGAMAFSAREIIADLLQIETLAASGRQGGKSRSAAKVAASRANGQRGGRPRLAPHP